MSYQVVVVYPITKTGQKNLKIRGVHATLSDILCGAGIYLLLQGNHYGELLYL